MDKQVQSSIAVVPGSLTAILEKRPSTPHGDRFLVIVDVEIEVHQAADLVVAVPQGINPLVKFLRLKVSAPLLSDGTRVRRTLRYEEAPAAADYREVWLGEGDSAISAKVALVM